MDDAVALLLAFSARDAFDLLGVTTVAGNVNSTLTAHNACVVRALAEREDVPVFAGAGRPLLVAPVEAGHFHGANGLGDLSFPAPKKGPESANAIAFLADTLSKATPKSISIAVLGPLTNIALALRANPASALGVREIVIMGGARSEGGNITASAEFNIYADPHAAAVVYSSGLPIVALGLDATHQVRTDPARMARLEALNSVRARAACQLLRFGERVERTLAQREGAPLHDPAVIAYLLAPELFDTQTARIDVETDSPLTRGHTAVDFRLEAPSATRWATRVRADGVFDLLERRLA
ncbi:MAG: nucleoside hydrolase [Hyphomonadaceae bacterium JAD_PAG50586_4]|nr:MAG: nucleoside hydrolase [Hyphomonadaceae bacterium JAD_PAG50586_4]